MQKGKSDMKIKGGLLKVKKRIIKLGSIILLIVTIGSSIFVYKYTKTKEECINLVKKQTSEINPNINFDKAYSKYLTDLDYTYYKDSQGNEIVSAAGNRYFPDKDKVCKIEIQYLVDRKTNELHFYKGFIDGAKINEAQMLILKIKAYDTYDSETI